MCWAGPTRKMTTPDKPDKKQLDILELLTTDWGKLSLSDWDTLAKGFLAELRLRKSDPNTDNRVSMAVTMMNFTAKPQQQWKFILAAVSLAGSDDELGHIAAGPIEHLLAWHGKDWIDSVDQQAAKDPTFARALTNVWRNQMTDDVWARVQTLQKQVTQPLQFSKPEYWQACAQKGKFHAVKGRHEKALEEYDKAIEAKPDYYLAWCGKGNALIALGRYEEALLAYDKALEIKPDEDRATLKKKVALAALNGDTPPPLQFHF